MYRTDRENLERQKENLHIFDQQLAKGKFNIEDIADFLPGYIHTNRLEDVTIQYINNKAEQYFGITLDELNEVGPQHLLENCHPTTFTDLIPKAIEFIKKNDKRSILGYTQLLRNDKSKDFDKFIGFAKISEELNSLICFENPVQVFGDLSNKMAALLDDNEFLRNNYKKFALLTKREIEIIKLIGFGHTRSNIADQLNISKHTLDNHRKHIREKLDIKTTAELFQYIRAFDLY